MYTPAQFGIPDVAAVHAFIRAHGFATVAGIVNGAIHFAYVPVALDGEPPPLGSARFHFASANPLAGISDGATLKFSFMGPHAYVSPDWYAAPGQVPTWNYTAAEGAGRVRRLNESETRAHLQALAAREEAALAPKPPWTLAKVETGRIAKLLNAIVGFHLVFETLDGKAKLSQNRSEADIAGTIAGLEARGDAASLAVAASMRRWHAK